MKCKSPDSSHLPASDGDALLRRFRQEHFASAPLYQAALARYGVTEEQLQQHLIWELTALRFTEQRFRLAGCHRQPNREWRREGRAAG